MVNPIRLWVASHGTPVVVSIDGKDVRRGGKGNSRSYWLRYRYTFDGRPQTGEQEVASQAYSLTKVGAEVPARAAQIGPWLCCVATLQPPMSTASRVTILLIWLGLLLVIYTSQLVDRLRIRRLVREGVPTAGLIVSHKVGGGKGAARTITFVFTTATGLEMKKVFWVDRAAYARAHVGSSVTVLYDPAYPKQSVPLEYCGYQVA